LIILTGFAKGQRINRWQKIVKFDKEGKKEGENGKLKRISRVIVTARYTGLF